ncbi:hypothetical protein AF74_06810 [Aliarcobacter butzleri L349]|nr:hypothetical protein AF74_06810 [Aliarcobacter butzleri L349]
MSKSKYREKEAIKSELTIKEKGKIKLSSR